VVPLAERNGNASTILVGIRESFFLYVDIQQEPTRLSYDYNIPVSVAKEYEKTLGEATYLD